MVQFLDWSIPEPSGMAEIVSFGRATLQDSTVAAAIDQDGLARDVGRSLGGQPDDHVGKFLGQANALDCGIGYSVRRAPRLLR